MVTGEIPILSQFRLVFGMPLGDERQRAFWEFSRKDFSALDINHCFGFSIDCMEMRSPVLAVENTDYNSEETA